MLPPRRGLSSVQDGGIRGEAWSTWVHLYPLPTDAPLIDMTVTGVIFQGKGQGWTSIMQLSTGHTPGIDGSY